MEGRFSMCFFPLHHARFATRGLPEPAKPGSVMGPFVLPQSRKVTPHEQPFVPCALRARISR